MSTNPLAEERMRILNMVKDGQITAEEAARLLEALKSTAAPDGRRVCGDGPGQVAPRPGN